MIVPDYSIVNVKASGDAHFQQFFEHLLKLICFILFNIYSEIIH